MPKQSLALFFFSQSASSYSCVDGLLLLGASSRTEIFRLVQHPPVAMAAWQKLEEAGLQKFWGPLSNWGNYGTDSHNYSPLMTLPQCGTPWHGYETTCLQRTHSVGHPVWGGRRACMFWCIVLHCLQAIFRLLVLFCRSPSEIALQGGPKIYVCLCLSSFHCLISYSIAFFLFVFCIHLSSPTQLSKATSTTGRQQGWDRQILGGPRPRHVRLRVRPLSEGLSPQQRCDLHSAPTVLALTSSA